MTRQTSAAVLPWAISCSAVLSLRMICSAVCLVRFMVESPTQSGRLRSLIHPGLVSGVHVMLAATMPLSRVVTLYQSYHSYQSKRDDTLVVRAHILHTDGSISVNT